MNRRPDLEMLRIILCAAVILQHATLIFAAEPRYHVKSIEISAWASVLYEALRIFAMPPFFAIAGWAAVESLRRRGAWAFVGARFSRLFVPLLAGILLLGPVIKYIELRHGRDMGLAGFRLVAPIQMDFRAFLPRYYTRIVLTTWSHLWFLAYLLLYSILFLPLLVRLSRVERIRRQPTAALVYLPAVATAGVLVLFHGYWPYLPNLVGDWGNFGYFALCFLSGTLIATWPGFEDRLRNQAWKLVAFTLLAFAGVVWYGESMAGRAFVGMAGWGCVAAAWGMTSRYQPVWSPRLHYLGQATFPVYIVHHVPLLLLGTWIAAWPLPIGLRIVLITVLATMISVAAFHWLIRPWPAVHWVTGGGDMKALRGK